tara:strand:- start:318 stop:1427 length:1110 start_codon:yes stop_codon:yes gene_type:complete
MSTLRVEALEQPDGTAFVFNNKNLLINGGMNVWQRSTSISITSTNYHSVDRWFTYLNSMGTWTQSRSTDVPSAQGFGYSLKMDCTTADASPAAGDYVMFQQRIEGQNLQHLLKGTSSAKKVTLSFWVKSNKTGTYICELRDQSNSRRISKSYTIDSASTWEKKTITFEGDTTGAFANNNSEALRVNWWLGAGSNFTSAGSLQTTWDAQDTNTDRVVGGVNLADSTSNEWYITGCQLEVGSTASGFEFEPYEATLRKCHRYFNNVGNITITTAASLDLDGGLGTNMGYIQIPFPTEMRVNPSISIGSQTLYRWTGGTGNQYQAQTSSLLGNGGYTINNKQCAIRFGSYANRSQGISYKCQATDITLASEL